MQVFLKISFVLSFIIAIMGCPKNSMQPSDDKPKTKRSFVWSIDTMFFDTPGILAPEQVNIESIWGSSPTDVWAAGQSDIPWGRLWHYDGKKWTPAKNWPVNGMDGGMGYIVYPFAVTGFDAHNVFVACDRYYDGSDSAMVLKWNGSAWIDVPFKEGVRANGGLGGIVSQNKIKCWATSADGFILKYENGFLSTEPRFTNYRLSYYQIASLDNGEVYVNAYKDSLVGEQFQGTISNLFLKSSSGEWSRVEYKYIPGSYYDGNGLGRSIFSAGNRLFTSNAGIWERKGTSWMKFQNDPDFGGSCTISENNVWTYFRQTLWNFNGGDWMTITIPLLANYPGGFLYAYGWSDGNEIFLSLHYNGKTYIVHGK